MQRRIDAAPVGIEKAAGTKLRPSAFFVWGDGATGGDAANDGATERDGATGGDAANDGATERDGGGDAANDGATGLISVQESIR